MKMLKNNKGFTLIELIVVIIILGIIGGLATPKVMETVKGSKVNATVTNVQLVGRAVDQYISEFGVAPTSTDLDARLSKTLANMGLVYTAPVTITPGSTYTLTITTATVGATGLAGTDAALFAKKPISGGITVATAATSPFVTFTMPLTQ